MNMNEKTIRAIEELEVSQIVDPQGFRHGFLVEVVRADQRDCEEVFFSTMTEAKGFYSGVVLTEPDERVGLYEGEFDMSYPWNDRPIPCRWAALVEGREASQKEVDWARAEEDHWERTHRLFTEAYWNVRDWLDGRTPAPDWA